MSAFFERRGLTPPSQLLRPETAREARQLLRDLHQSGRPTRPLGDGQHTRRRTWETPTGAPPVALSTTGLDHIIEIQRKSAVLRVEAGLSWRSLHEIAHEEGFSLHRYGLHPSSATLGGLLSRFRPGPPELRTGDLVDGCIGLGAHDPDADDYRYLVAPRKASGPDLRHHFIGAEGRNGLILDAAIVLWRPQPRRLLLYDDLPLSEAAHRLHTIYRAGLRPAFIHYALRRRTLQICLTAPGQLLRSRIQWLNDHFGAPDDLLHDDDADTRRAWLEARHPDRRAHPDASTTRAVWFTPAGLLSDTVGDHLGPLKDLEITAWTNQRIEAYLTHQPDDLPRAHAHTFSEGDTWADWWLMP